MKTHTNPINGYQRCADQDRDDARHPVVVVGAGPVGLAVVIDLARRGVTAMVLDENDTVSVGSRAICDSNRSVEILDRLNAGQHIVDKGIGWNGGKVWE